MGKLLNEVDRLSSQLHEAFPTISETDYKAFGPELKIVIDTLKSLRKENISRGVLKTYNERLRMQIADLEELDNDIKVFRVNAPKNAQLQSTMSALGNLDLSKYVQ